jgi:NAD(P)-dependent dehydrogenase (short-subunit alcohol dehydrogenase family)
MAARRGETDAGACRDRERGAAAAESLGVRFVVLVNNAGIVGPRSQVRETTAEDVRLTFETNVFGAVRVVRAFTDLLDDSPAPVVVNVSSGVGSLAYASDPAGPAAEILLLGYPSSKAALNMLTVKWARAHPRCESTPRTPASLPPTSTPTAALRPCTKALKPSCTWPASLLTARPGRSLTATAHRSAA